MIPPSAKVTVPTGHGTRWLRIGNKELKTFSSQSCIRVEFAQPQSGALPVAQLDMRAFRFAALDVCEKIGVERELKHMARVRFALKLGVSDLVAECSEV